LSAVPSGHIEVMLTTELPNFCRNIFVIIQERRFTHGLAKPNYSYAIISAVKIVIALLVIGERKRIIGLLDKKQDPSEDTEEIIRTEN
jgi:hypothetical protein